MSRSYTSLYCVKNLQQRNIRVTVCSWYIPLLCDPKVVRIWQKHSSCTYRSASVFEPMRNLHKKMKMLKRSNQITDTTKLTLSPLLQNNAFWKDLRWVYEMQVWDVLLRFGVFGAVDFAVHQRVPCRLEERDFCSLWLTPNLALERVVVPYVLFRGKADE